MFKSTAIFFKSFGNMLWGYKKAFKASPEFVIYKVVFAIFQALQNLIQSVFLLAFLISCIEEKREFSYALKFIIIAAIIITAKFLLESIGNHKCLIMGKEKILRDLSLELYDKSIKMDLSFYDDPKFYNDFVWAMNDAPQQIILSFNLVHWGVYVSVTALITGIYISTQDAIGVIAVAISVFLRVVIHIIAVKKEIKMEEEKKPFQRKRDYINRVFYLIDFAKDIRLSNIKDLLFDDFEDSNKNMSKVVKKHSKTLVFLTQTYYSITTAILNLYLIWLLYCYFFLGTIQTLGVVVSLHNAINSMSNSLTNLANVLPEIQRTGLYIEKMRHFLNTKNNILDEGKEKLPENFDILLENVSFSYPGSEKQVLKNINLSIPKGSKIAIVGYNGSGKSTLVKLIMRLYDPSSGEIKLGEHNIKKYPLGDYRDSISTLFQDFQIMAATLGENICMDDTPLDREKAENILSLTGFTPIYNKLSNKMDTLLTKEFDAEGVNFSGGESQKIAISRALYSDAKLLILDEPSSALDPLSEYTLNHTITELAKDRTIIFISHRLSTTKIADKIYMLENGQIIEEGTHSELMQKKGKYSEMFLLQAKKYR